MRGDAVGESALEPPPGQIGVVQQIANVRAGQGNGLAFVVRSALGAVIVVGITVAVHGASEPGVDRWTLTGSHDSDRRMGPHIAVPVSPEMRLMAPGVEGPKVVLNELSFIA